MLDAIYIGCAATSLLCALLLLRGYTRDGSRLLLWSGICFAGLAVNNALLLVDPVDVPQIDLWRKLPTILGLAVLNIALIWQSR